MNPIQTEKRCLKALVSKIRTAKAEVKKLQRENGCAYTLAQTIYDLDWLRYLYRHRHIAYCMTRGRTYEQVERKVASGHEPNMALVAALREQLQISCLQSKGAEEGPEMDALMEQHEATSHLLTPGQIKLLYSVSAEHQEAEKVA